MTSNGVAMSISTSSIMSALNGFVILLNTSANFIKESVLIIGCKLKDFLRWMHQIWPPKFWVCPLSAFLFQGSCHKSPKLCDIQIFVGWLDPLPKPDSNWFWSWHCMPWHHPFVIYASYNFHEIFALVMHWVRQKTIVRASQAMNPHDIPLLSIWLWS